jgi:four helix bundle protein
MAHFRNLIVWQKSLSLAKQIYQITGRFPSDQRYRLVDQMQRAAVSIMSNIAEGSKRTKKECDHFFRIAHGSAAELESQLLLTLELAYITKIEADQAMDELDHITRMLRSMYLLTD